MHVLYVHIHVYREFDITSQSPNSRYMYIVQLGPNVYVGAGVVIGAGARVREAIVLDRAVIQVSIMVQRTFVHVAS